jgi:transposase InsO family protein
MAKAFRSGFYWLSALYDARNIVQHCEACQMFTTKPHAPASELHTIPVAWPFAQWGLDQVGPLPKSSRGGTTYLLVAVDKFSKWIEAVPVTNQEATTAVKFFESIVYRYDVPNSIITDNGTNFTSGEFQDFAKDLGIKLKYASIAHPKSNGQVEKANGLVCGGLKKRLLRPLNAQQAPGSRNCLRCYGAYEQRPTPRRATHLSSCSSEQKQCYPRMCATARPVSPPMSRKIRTRH